jgi:hypothetical protein
VSNDPALKALVGVWRLIDYVDRESEADPWVQTFGSDPIGLGMYHPSGLLSMQVFADQRSRSTAAYVAYVGTYRLREAHQDGEGFSGVVEHLMVAASDPALMEEAPDRPFRVSGDRLVLGDGLTWRRLFERVV